MTPVVTAGIRLEASWFESIISHSYHIGQELKIKEYKIDGLAEKQPPAPGKNNGTT
jgi:hypothetical protein